MVDTQVGESLKRFGLSPKSTCLLLVKFSSSSADKAAILESMLDLVSPGNLTTPTEDTPLDIDQAIRYGRYPSASQKEEAVEVTDWKELNKIYKLQIPCHQLSDSKAKTEKGESWQTIYEEIVCTSVAMKLVAA